MGIIAFSEGCGLLLDVSENNIDGPQRQVQFLKMAEHKIGSSVKSSGASYPRQYYYWGNVYYELALRSGEERAKYLDYALDKYQTITSARVFTRGDPFVPKILFQEALVACAKQDWKRATKRFKRSAKLANSTVGLKDRLKSLLLHAGQRQAASIMNILYEAGAKLEI